MDDKELDDVAVFFRMAREFPVRTSLFTFGLPVFALLQLLNGFIYNGSLVFIGLFAVLVTAVSVNLTQYYIAVYRRQQLTHWWR